MMDLFIIHLALTLFMTGLIWTVQRVHYPSFFHISAETFSRFSAFHVRSISTIVFPVMGLELITGMGLIIVHPTMISWVNVALILLTWACTVFLSMPIHRKLAQGFHQPTAHRLVQTNWLRTIIWSARSLLLLLTLKGLLNS